MRIAIVGAGPAGLYLGYRLKRDRRDLEVEVFEQNPADATFGFGVVFSDRALDFLGEDDPETLALLAPAMERWEDLRLVHRGEAVTIDGIGFAAIARLALLAVLRQQAADVGVTLHYGRQVPGAGALSDRDLIVGADGVNSVVRASDPQEFGATRGAFGNRFIWFGVRRAFPALTQSFVETGDGPFNAHHYRYTPDLSTFIVECDPRTWRRAGLAAMAEAETRAYCEKVFSDALQGSALISNRSVWRRFPRIRCRQWSVGKRVLIGDALRTAHFSIGSGTGRALGDATALARALRDHDYAVAAALEAYQDRRQPVVEKLVAAADESAAWYENFAGHMALPPVDLAWSYITRSGRVDVARLRRTSPRFAARLEGDPDVTAP